MDIEYNCELLCHSEKLYPSTFEDSGNIHKDY